MDFKATIAAEIEAKKRALEKVATGEKKSVKVAELERQRQEEYLAKQKQIEEEREVRTKKLLVARFSKFSQAKLKAKLEKLEKSNENKATPGNADTDKAEEPIDVSLNKEVEKELMSRGEPIRMFAESDRQRLSRLRKLQLREEERAQGQRNDFHERLQDEDEEDGGNKRVKVNEELPESIAEIKRIDRKLLLQNRAETRQLMAIFFKTLLKEWQVDLDARSEEQKKSGAGRVATATHQQAGDYLKPFFRLLARDELADDILAHLSDICGFLQEREYVRANDTYLRLSIGNAPWPIGVTMVGIHERSAHEKITTDNVAHVLNDEVSRKWIQSIKRLMTFCQKAYPPSDPSKAMGWMFFVEIKSDW